MRQTRHASIGRGFTGWRGVAIALLAAAGAATAAPMAYDPFNQSTGDIDGTASASPGYWPTGGQNWSVATGPIDVVSGSLTSPTVTIPTNGNRVQLPNTGSQVAAFRNFGESYSSSTSPSIWFSFLYTPGSGGNEGISLFNGGTAPTDEQIFFGSRTVGPSPYADELGVFAYGGAGRALTGADTFAAATTTAAQTYLIIAQVQFGSAYNIWVNPTDVSGASPTGGSFASITAGLPGSFNFDSIRVGTLTGTSLQTTAEFDEFRMGTTLGSVIPEPATLSLLALGGIAIARRLRRKP